MTNRNTHNINFNVTERFYLQVRVYWTLRKTLLQLFIAGGDRLTYVGL